MNYTRFAQRTIRGEPSRQKVVLEGPDIDVIDSSEILKAGTASKKPNFSDSKGKEVKRLNILIPIFLLSLVVPIFFYLGPIRLSPSRIFLMFAIFPAVFFWVSGRAGSVRLADILVVSYGSWIFLSLLVTEGTERLPYATITVIETICPYLLARVMIRSVSDYCSLLYMLRLVVIFLVPAAVIEALTTVMPYSVLLGKFATTFGKADHYDFRLGLSRAQVVFEHPILFGVFVSTLFAPIFALALMKGGGWFRILTFVSPILAATFLSLSSGAYLCLIVQFGFLIWGYLFRHRRSRWTGLAFLALISYLTVDMGSNRTPFEVFTSYLTFDSSTAYMRILIFQFGMENVFANPIFGLGFSDWIRPIWLRSPSVDNFWLLTAMRYGVPAFVFVALGIVAALATMAVGKPKSTEERRFRDAHVFSLIGLSIAICTVHLWSATYVFAMFMIGAGMWVADADSDVVETGSTDPARGRRATS